MSPPAGRRIRSRPYRHLTRPSRSTASRSTFSRRQRRAAVLGGFAMLLSPKRSISCAHDVFVTARDSSTIRFPRYALLDHTDFDEALRRAVPGRRGRGRVARPISRSRTLLDAAGRRRPLSLIAAVPFWKAVRASGLAAGGCLPPLFTDDGPCWSTGRRRRQHPAAIDEDLEVPGGSKFHEVRPRQDSHGEDEVVRGPRPAGPVRGPWCIHQEQALQHPDSAWNLRQPAPAERADCVVSIGGAAASSVPELLACSRLEALAPGRAGRNGPTRFSPVFWSVFHRSQRDVVDRRGRRPGKRPSSVKSGGSTAGSEPEARHRLPEGDPRRIR